MSTLAKKIDKVLKVEGDRTTNKITANLKFNDQYVTGKSAQSLNAESENGYLAISGRDDFSQLETGISPQKSNKNTVGLAKILYNWSANRNLPFGDNKKRFSFAYNAAKKQNDIGSVLYRKGGRNDVLSNEIEPLIERIQLGLDGVITEIEIVK